MKTKTLQNTSLNKEAKSKSTMKTLTCSVDWDNKSVTKAADGNVYVEGFANTSDKDRVGDVILPSAFTKTLKEYMDNPVLLFQHDWDKLAGHCVEAKVVDGENVSPKGLWVKAKISNATDVEDVRTKIKEGSLKTFSIGYNEVDADFDDATNTNTIKELELLEISMVTIPCNPFAKFTSTVDEVKSAIDDELISFVSAAVADLKDAKDATPEFLKEVISIFKDGQTAA